MTLSAVSWLALLLRVRAERICLTRAVLKHQGISHVECMAGEEITLGTQPEQECWSAQVGHTDNPPPALFCLKSKPTNTRNPHPRNKQNGWCLPEPLTSVLMASQDLEVFGAQYSCLGSSLASTVSLIAHSFVPGAMLPVPKNVAKALEFSFNTTSSSFYTLEDLQPALPE